MRVLQSVAGSGGSAAPEPAEYPARGMSEIGADPPSLGATLAGEGR